MSESEALDVVVVGAGMAGLYLLHRLRADGFSARAFETADDVGGTWYWNRYPGARCDIESVDYSYSWDPELEREWTWSERYATQPEILAYLGHVADKHELRRDITFETSVDTAVWDDDSGLWTLETSGGETVRARHYVMATGCLSRPKDLDIEGTEDFGGELYWTSRWPHEGVDFTGKRVAVIGTGSSGIQSIPIIAAQAAELTIHQRTANFSIPARNGPVVPEKLERWKSDPAAYREANRWTRGGVNRNDAELPAAGYSAEQQAEMLEAMWAAGELLGIGVFADTLLNPEANEIVAEFIRNKIRETVNDPETAELLCPDNHPVGSKRACLDTNYYETYNLPHVSLVDLRSDPIECLTATGIRTASGEADYDAIVFATGFDAMTGALVAVDITGRDGVTLADKWSGGPVTYLGLTTVGFPNLWMITGPGSPSVLSNMSVSIEQHVDFVVDTLNDLRDGGHTRIEPTPTAESGWVQHVNDCANITLFPLANSWYMGANVPGKPRVFLPYIGGVDRYRRTCDTVREHDYLGFTRSDGTTAVVNDGVVNRLQLDVSIMLEIMAELELPSIDSMSPVEARGMMTAMAEQRPPGPEVGEIVDGTWPAPGGGLAYRLYRPASEGPHPVVLWFHGGGWVIGSEQSDDPLCRELCVTSDSVVVSVDYRHGPEARFPAAHDDAIAAADWVAMNLGDFGGIEGPIAVAGWSAGANLAGHVALACRDRRAAGERAPELSSVLMLTPVTDTDFGRASYEENAEGYVLTRALMTWFLDHYVDEADRTDPRLALVHAASLADLPPTMVVTAEFDPLRDEGAAYAAALADAGVDVTHRSARGQTHTTVGAVGAIVSANELRTEMADFLRKNATVGV